MDGMVNGDEVCDDGVNDGAYGGCNSDCLSLAAFCGDAEVNGPESCDDDNDDLADGCLPNCEIPGNCMEILAYDAMATDGVYVIDVAEDPFAVYCDMTLGDGGWTLVLVSSDDDTDTWTWAQRAFMATDPTILGDLDALNLDFKSRAYNELVFQDLLFVHAPSGVWAEYDLVGEGDLDLGQFIGAISEPVCDLDLADASYEMSGGTLMVGQNMQGYVLCDTDLYFNLGDHENGPVVCQNTGAVSANATYGPVWNSGNDTGCPFDDPGLIALGPQAQCGACGPETIQTEYSYVGFGNQLDLNTGQAGAGENYMRVYIR